MGNRYGCKDVMKQLGYLPLAGYRQAAAGTTDTTAAPNLPFYRKPWFYIILLVAAAVITLGVVVGVTNPNGDEPGLSAYNPIADSFSEPLPGPKLGVPCEFNGVSGRCDVKEPTGCYGMFTNQGNEWNQCLTTGIYGYVVACPHGTCAVTTNN